MPFSYLGRQQVLLPAPCPTGLQLVAAFREAVGEDRFNAVEVKRRAGLTGYTPIVVCHAFYDYQWISDECLPHIRIFFGETDEPVRFQCTPMPVEHCTLWAISDMPASLARPIRLKGDVIISDIADTLPEIVKRIVADGTTDFDFSTPKRSSKFYPRGEQPGPW